MSSYQLFHRLSILLVEVFNSYSKIRDTITVVQSTEDKNMDTFFQILL